MAEHYFTVGTHGAPTRETAPHGFRWRAATGQRWFYGDFADIPANANDQWAPLPAPPTEEAPAPEPEPDEWWRPYLRGDGGWGLCCAFPGGNFNKDEAHAAADALNALDRDGVAWGPGRPMSELPETGRVIVQLRNRGASVVWAEDIREAAAGTYLGWWPLPLPGEAQ